MFANRQLDLMFDLRGYYEDGGSSTPELPPLIHFNTGSRECKQKSNFRTFTHLRKRRVDEPRMTKTSSLGMTTLAFNISDLTSIHDDSA